MAAPRGERLIITLLGRRNVGKSSLINGITQQDISIVSKTPGTTTDPVAKHYELIPVGPVTFYDTAGIDDIGELGEQRVKATRRVLWRSDVVMLVFDKETLDSLNTIKYEVSFYSRLTIISFSSPPIVYVSLAPT